MSVTCDRSVVFSCVLLISSTNKTDCHNIIEILLKGALKSITLTLKVPYMNFFHHFPPFLRSSFHMTILLSEAAGSNMELNMEGIFPGFGWASILHLIFFQAVIKNDFWLIMLCFIEFRLSSSQTSIVSYYVGNVNSFKKVETVMVNQWLGLKF